MDNSFVFKLKKFTQPKSIIKPHSTQPVFKDIGVKPVFKDIGVKPHSSTQPSSVPPNTNLPSSILIVMDQLIAYHNLPPQLLKLLPGYNAFKNRGIEFTNMHVNRQMCSPSRSTILTSTINTGIQSNIDLFFQYPYKDHLDYDAETIPKSLKKKYVNLNTAYFGKEHLTRKLDTGSTTHPEFNLNTTGAYKCYGFDKGTMFGDSFYRNGHGFAADNLMMNTVLNNINVLKDKSVVDYIETDPITNEQVGYVGVLPYLKARAKDKKQFHMQCHITNPHDSQEFYSNFTQVQPITAQSQFWAPFLTEQTSVEGATNPYEYDSYFTDAYVKIHNLIENYFEKDYNTYKTSTQMLPFKTSYANDYAQNSDNELYKTAYVVLGQAMTMADDKEDIKTWKNLINNYYGLVIEADKYVLKIFNFLNNHKGALNNVSVVITSDHGDLMSAHGLKQKGFPFKECVNIPCIVVSPHIPLYLQGKKSTVLGSLLDIAPTIDTLMGKHFKNEKFLGTSLLTRQYNKLIPRTQNVPVMNIFNDYLYGLGCLFDPEYTKSIVEFKFCFTMIIDYHNNQLIKFGRFFNILGLLEYQLQNINIPFSIFEEQNINLEISNNFTSLLSEFNSVISNSIYNGESTFDFKTLYTIVKPNPILTLFLFIIVYKYSVSENGALVTLPNVNDNFNDIINDTNLNIFCYNMTNDPSEINNLYKTDYNNNEDLFFEFNNKLNKLTKEKCMTTNQTPTQDGKFEFFVPTIMYELTLLIYLKYGTDYSKYSDKIKILIKTNFFMNNYDSKISYDLMRDNLINLLNTT